MNGYVSISTLSRRLPMTLPKNKKLKKNEIKSMKIAVEQAGIRAIHPDKLEDFAEHLVRQARKSEKPVAWRRGSALSE